MARRISLREFQQELSRRLTEVKIAGRRASLLAFSAREDNWLVDLVDVGEIIAAPALTVVPLTRNWFRGLVNVRGNLYSVVDLAAFSGEVPGVLNGDSRILLIGMRHGQNSALLVSRAQGLRYLDDFDTDDGFVDPRPWIDGALRDAQGRLWKRLAVRALLADARFLDAGALIEC